MMNIYWTKIKLRASANQTIYLVIFHWVVGSLYSKWYINCLLDRCRVFKRLAIGHFLCCPPSLKSGGRVPLIPTTHGCKCALFPHRYK